VHFEVAVPDASAAIDEGGFLKDNADGKRERNPKFCGIRGSYVLKDAEYRANPC
jgi:hypothetical protein